MCLDEMEGPASDKWKSAESLGLTILLTRIVPANPRGNLKCNAI